jgi:hypothetical protein
MMHAPTTVKRLVARVLYMASLEVVIRSPKPTRNHARPARRLGAEPGGQPDTTRIRPAQPNAPNVSRVIPSAPPTSSAKYEFHPFTSVSSPPHMPIPALFGNVSGAERCFDVGAHSYLSASIGLSWAARQAG